MNGLHRLVGLGFLLIAAGAATACDGDDPQGTGGGGATGPGSGGSGGETTSSTMSGGGGGTGGSDGVGGGGGGTGGGGGSPPECDMLPAGPLDAVEWMSGLDGSEDFAFDGKGHIAARQGDDVVLVDAAQQVTTLASAQDPSYGMRFRADGSLLLARPSQGTIAEITPAGVVSQYAAGLQTPNGLYPDSQGNVWVTEFGGDQVSRINPDKSVDSVVSGSAVVSSPNGIVFDEKRSVLFYTNYGAGEIMRVNLAPGGDPTPTLVSTINGALDGLVLDACGNLYVVDNGYNRLYRVRLDPGGIALGEAELLASFPSSVANAQFGSGQGFEPMSLYVAGAEGSIYAVQVGVPGAPVPTAP